MRVLLTVLILFTAFTNIYPQTPAVPNENIESSGDTKTILMLPFYNYSNSEFEYLSAYIPELIAGKLGKYEGINIYDPVSLRREIAAADLSPELFYYNDAVGFLKKKNADLAIAGRYVIQGNFIKIDFKVINTASGMAEKGYEYEGSMDENLLGSLDRFSKAGADWIVKYVLASLTGRIDLKDKTQPEKVLNVFRTTKIGKIIGSKWILAGIIIFLSWLIGKGISFTLKKLSPKIKFISHDRIGISGIRKFRKSLKRITILFGIKLAVLSLGISPVIYETLNDIIIALILALAAYAMIIVIEGSLSIWGGDFTSKVNPRINRDLMPLFVTLTKVFIVTIIFIIILSRFDIDVAPFLASIGILGIAIGFAVKDSLANIIGGIFLALDKSIAAGDMIKIDGDTGTIQEVGIRNTKLLTFDNELIIIPNGELANKKFKNYVLPDPSFRVVVSFSVAYGTSAEMVEEVVLDAVKSMEGVIRQPEPVCFFEEMADFSLVFQAKFWIPDYRQKLIMKKEGTRIIYNALNKAGIQIPFPTHTVYMKNIKE